MSAIESPPPSETPPASGTRATLARILSSPRRRLISVLLAIGVVGAGVWAGYAMLGPSGPAHAGEVRFAAFQGVNVCDVGDAVEVLPSGSLMFWSAVFSSSVPVGHELVVERAKDGVIEPERTQKFTADRWVDCMGTPIADGPVYSGTYTLTIRDGATILATGSLTVR